jgi:hypothetical protein
MQGLRSHHKRYGRLEKSNDGVTTKTVESRLQQVQSISRGKTRMTLQREMDNKRHTRHLKPTSAEARTTATHRAARTNEVPPVSNPGSPKKLAKSMKVWAAPVATQTATTTCTESQKIPAPVLATAVVIMLSLGAVTSKPTSTQSGPVDCKAPATLAAPVASPVKESVSPPVSAVTVPTEEFHTSVPKTAGQVPEARLPVNLHPGAGLVTSSPGFTQSPPESDALRPAEAFKTSI